jgi:hypothetical protein
MARRARPGDPEVFVVTGVPAFSQNNRRNRYMLMMFLRVLLVPGVLLLPVPGTVQALLVCVAAITQMVAVIMANEPSQPDYDNPALYLAAAGELPAPTSPAASS